MGKHVEQEAAKLVTFFEKTGTGSRAFDEVLTTWKGTMPKEQALAMLAEKDTLKALVRQCKQGKVEKEILHSVRNLLRNTGKPDADWFQGELVGELGDEFKPSFPLQVVFKDFGSQLDVLVSQPVVQDLRHGLGSQQRGIQLDRDVQIVGRHQVLDDGFDLVRGTPVEGAQSGGGESAGYHFHG